MTHGALPRLGHGTLLAYLPWIVGPNYYIGEGKATAGVLNRTRVQPA